MKKYKIPILTDEYYIRVYIGKRKELITQASKYLEISKQEVSDRFGEARGVVFNTLKYFNGPKSPLILVDGDMSLPDVMASLAHESVHAVSYIFEYIRAEDNEIFAHAVGVVVRQVGKTLKQFKK